MTKTALTSATALLFALLVATGGAFAGDGSCDKGKKDRDGDSAAVVLPAGPLA